MRTYLLRQGYAATIAERTLRKLRVLNYLNDESFARDYASSRAQEQSCGPLKIEEDLKRKGIAQAIIARVLRETFGGGNEAEMARACLQKRFKNENLSEPKVARRAAAFLQRRGYTGEVITDLIKCPVGDI